MRLVRGTGLLFAGTMAGNVLNVGYTFLMARLLGQEAYASLVAIISLLVILSLPSGTIQTVVARFVAVAENERDPGRLAGIVRGLAKVLLPAAAIVTVALALLARPLSAFLQITDTTPLLVLAPLFGLSLLLPLFRGALQGVRQFGLLASLGLLDVSFKLFLGVALAWYGFGVTGALLAMLVGAVVGLALSVLPLWSRVWRTPVEQHAVEAVPAGALTDLWQASLPTLGTLGGLFSMVTLDAVLVKHYFPAETAGAFAALAITGRSLYWAAGAVSMALLPLVSKGNAQRDGEAQAGGTSAAHRRTFWWSMALTAALCLMGEAAFVVAPHLVLGLLFGSKYDSAADLLPLYGLGTACLALANVAIYFLMAQGRGRASVVSLACAASQVVLVVLFHGTLAQVIVALVASNAVLLVSSLALAMQPERLKSGPVSSLAA